MIDYLKKELNRLSSRKHVDKKTINKFFKRLDQDTRLVKEENPADHFCCFFLPFCKKVGLIYLVNHIIAKEWIPPGGHIKKDELPLKTVTREFSEELNYKLSEEKIELFDLSILKINNLKRTCQIHYDLWYLVYTDRINFVFDNKEFNRAGWFSIKDGQQLMKTRSYNFIVGKLDNVQL
jgi:8-oxo-dGTP pyrophosphatase MutT (NUDIX family)